MNLPILTADAAGGDNTMYMVLQIGSLALIFVFFYFIFIRPQKKKEKEAQAMRENVQIGDEIMTAGGIVGIVIKKSEDTVVIETGGDKSKLRIKNWAIQENITAMDEARAVAQAQKEEREAKIKGKLDK